MKVKRAVINIFLILCIVAATGSGTLLVRETVHSWENQEIFESAAQLVEEVAKERMEERGGVVEKDDRLLGYDRLRQQNRDFVGWVCIEETGIDYPVMQTRTGEDFYLDHNFEREPSAYGVPFVDGSCELEKGNCRNVVVYGHHMKDQSMFADLVRYEEQSYQEEHPVILFDTWKERGEYRIIGVLRVPDVEEEMSFYRNMECGDEKQYEAFVDEVEERSLYDCGVGDVQGEQLLTLVTCEYSTKDGRMVVVAKKIS